ncbi:hypothetical protein QQF64_002055 [Cirrhinus molitorella]|uniref:Uncharacterized protein n=1 Tax=Cirrhinus molitorella TaxID=172907 RepID=A0ABR3MP88_9TELE
MSNKTSVTSGKDMGYSRLSRRIAQSSGSNAEIARLTDCYKRIARWRFSTADSSSQPQRAWTLWTAAWRSSSSIGLFRAAAFVCGEAEENYIRYMIIVLM